MINQFYHAGSGAVVQFPHNPLRVGGDLLERRQSLAHDSDGAAYVYSKNAVKHGEYPLVYNRCSLAVLNALETFIQARNGDKVSFSWYDHNATLHTVRFTTGTLRYKQITPGSYRVEVRVSEDTA